MLEKRIKTKDYLMTYGWAAMMIVVVFVSLYLIPIIFITSLNILFGTTIKLGIYVWLAIFILIFYLGSFGYGSGILSSKTKHRMKLLALFVVWIVVGPLLFIWSLNQLFLLQLHYTAYSWLASLAVGLILNSSSFAKGYASKQERTGVNRLTER